MRLNPNCGNVLLVKIVNDNNPYNAIPHRYAVTGRVNFNRGPEIQPTAYETENKFANLPHPDEHGWYNTGAKEAAIPTGKVELSNNQPTEEPERVPLEALFGRDIEL